MKHPRLALLLLLAAFALPEGSAAEVIKLAAPAPPGTAQRLLAERFKEQIEARSEGLYTVVINPEDMSPKEAEAFEQLQTGSIQMGVIAATTVEKVNPVTRVLSFPYLFRSEQQVDAILDGPLGSTILRDMETVGCKGLGFSEGGFKHLTNDIRPIKTAEDLKDLKIRVVASPLQTAFWISLGATPTPRPWPIYADMEWGRIDGQDSTLRIIEVYGFHEVQKHLSLTRHGYVAYLNLASLKWWATLSLHDQEMIRDAMAEAARLQRREQRASDETRLIALAGKGMAIERYPDLASFRAKAAGMQEMAFFREPKVQVLLTRMLAAADALPDPQPVAMKEAGTMAQPGPPPADASAVQVAEMPEQNRADGATSSLADQAPSAPVDPLPQVEPSPTPSDRAELIDPGRPPANPSSQQSLTNQPQSEPETTPSSTGLPLIRQTTTSPADSGGPNSAVSVGEEKKLSAGDAPTSQSVIPAARETVSPDGRQTDREFDPSPDETPQTTRPNPLPR